MSIGYNIPMIGTLIVAFLITIISFLLGVLVALFFSKNDTIERVQERIDNFRHKEPLIGLVERPSAEDLRRRGTIEEETEEEMSRQLKKLGLKPKK